MSDFEHLVSGPQPVFTTSELASPLRVPVQTIHDLHFSGRGQTERRRVTDWDGEVRKVTEPTARQRTLGIAKTTSSGQTAASLTARMADTP